MLNHNKILLVDDDTDDQLFFVDAINELEPHLACEIVNNGSEALDHLKKVPPPPSLIFLDLNMPKMNGFECFAQLKKKINIKTFLLSFSPHQIIPLIRRAQFRWEHTCFLQNRPTLLP